MFAPSDDVTILVVDDSNFFRLALTKSIEDRLGFRVLAAKDFAEALHHIVTEGENIFLALLDFNLPDAPNGEVIDFALEQRVPSLVFTGYFNENMREEFGHKDIIDYIVKSGPSCIETAVSTIHRIYKNQFVKALVVDDSRVARSVVRKYLESFRFQVVEAEGGEEALGLIKTHSDIKIVVTDYNMPNMSGIELVGKIRAEHSRKKIAIIGISAQGNNIMSTEFVKSGANDFLGKPFLREELFCRVGQNIDNLEQIEALENALVTDYLTGLRNRAYLFERGEKMRLEAAKDNKILAAAVINITSLRHINNAFGHAAGDAALQKVARSVAARFSTFGIAARLGGGEFAVLMVTDNGDHFSREIAALEQDVANRSLQWNGEDLSVSIAYGVCLESFDNLDESFSCAEGNLSQ